MDLDFEVLKQVAYSLADHYLCVYYVNVNSGRYVVVTGEARQEDKNSDLPVEGNNFFADWHFDKLFDCYTDNHYSDNSFFACSFSQKNFLIKMISKI